MRTRTKTLLASAVAALAIAAGGCAAAPAAVKQSATATPMPPTLAERTIDAAKGCAKVVSETLVEGDNGRTVSFQTVDNDFRGLGFTQPEAGCILRQLGATDAVMSHITSTRALDGQQSDAWNGVRARWTFSANQGLNITLTARSSVVSAFPTDSP